MRLLPTHPRALVPHGGLHPGRDRPPARPPPRRGGADRGVCERRLVDAGKPKMQAIGACMRKLVMIAYGVLKNRTPFDPDWTTKKSTRQHATWFGRFESPRHHILAEIEPERLVVVVHLEVERLVETELAVNRGPIPQVEQWGR